jgi:hypothetical protein
MLKMGRSMKSAGRPLLVLFSLCLGCARLASGQDVSYRAQSLFIYQFTKYVTWPEENMNGDFYIGVYGNCPIYEELVTMASLKKAANGNRIVISQVGMIQEAGIVHILYIPSSKSREISMINQMTAQQPVLVVAEREGLARKGAIINFMVMEDGTLKFEINMTALRQRSLSISPELLKLGFIVE